MKNKYPIIPYNPKLKKIARELRNNMTLSEILLWKQIKGKKMMGHDFDRQRPIDNYIVDFYCKELKLAIEIDGDSHNEDTKAYDMNRQERLELLGVRFLRFDDYLVKTYLEDVLNVIKKWILKNRM